MFSNQEQHHTHSQNNLPHPQGEKKKARPYITLFCMELTNVDFYLFRRGSLFSVTHTFETWLSSLGMQRNQPEDQTY